ncbi:MAG TPA: pilus assembly protein TadG-related protein [Symbiobacteriaceae bacterium]|nr:pilus assembly protein TadG-related protein [Symbiobacteriaceae bacterium]
MKRRFGSGRGQGGYVTVYSALVITFVLVPMLFFALDVVSLMYYKAKAQNLADAAALAAVKDTTNWHIPIPDTWAWIIPVDGWFINLLTLKNVGWSASLRHVPESELNAAPKGKLVALNKDRSWGKDDRMHLGKIQALPGNFPSPIIGVRAPVTATVKVYTPFLARAMASGKSSKGGPDTVTISAEACAMAWYRPDYIVHRWWTPQTMDNLFDIPGTEPLKYYRAVDCPHGAWDLVKLIEAPVTEFLFTKYGKDDGQRKLDEWKAESDKQMQEKRGEDQGCSKNCGGMKVGTGTDRTWDQCHQSWGTCRDDLKKEGDRKKAEAEEEAKKSKP